MMNVVVLRSLVQCLLHHPRKILDFDIRRKVTACSYCKLYFAHFLASVRVAVFPERDQEAAATAQRPPRRRHSFAGESAPLDCYLFFCATVG